MRAVLRTTVSLVSILLLMLSASAVAMAQQASDISLDSPIRSFELGQGEVRADLDIDLKNVADSRRLVKFVLEDLPEDWKIGIWNRFFDFKITDLVVEPTEDTPGQRPRLRIDFPDDRPAAGDYSFVLRITSPDGAIEYDTATFTITVPEEDAEEAGTLTLRSSYPVLSGPASSRYQFEVVIRNETGEERSFDLRADVLVDGVPQRNWQISFVPSFGEEKIIANVSVPDSLTENVDIRVTPPRNTRPGDYIIPVVVSADGYTEQTLLQLTIAGQGQLLATTDTELLSVDAVAGAASDVVLRLWNLGTAPLTDITISADRPTDWEINFDTTEIDSLSDAAGENRKDVPLKITPRGDAVPGDYIVTLRASSADSSDTVELRVTVTQSTIWGWLGIVLVLGVLGGLVGLFLRLGRR